MIVDRARHQCTDAACELTARVRSEAWDREEFTLWYRLPSAVVSDHGSEPDCSTFVPALLPWCLRRAEPLVVDGPVSPRLLNAVPVSTDVFHAFWPDLITPVEVSAQASAPTATGTGIGSLFTGGVDSWYTACTYGRRPYDNGSLTHLVHVPSISFMYDDATGARATRAIEVTARSISKTPVIVETNLRRHTERFFHWGHYHGAVLASIGLAVGLDELLIPATRSYGYLCAWGSHPFLDPLWSTERTRIVHHGAEATRWDKIVELSGRPEILGTLKVCHEENTDGNCGQCPKCLMTMAMLAARGVLDACPFDAPLEARRLSRLKYRDADMKMMRAQVLPELQPPDLRRALQVALLRAGIRGLADDGVSALKTSAPGRFLLHHGWPRHALRTGPE